MDEERQADGTGGAEATAWRGNGALDVSGGAYPYRADQPWSSAGEALEPAAEPLALLAPPQPPYAQAPPGQPPSSQPPSSQPPSSQPPGPEPVGGQRRYAPGLDDDTPVGGLSSLEPPLWREAVRHAPSSGAGSGAGYGAPPTQYRPSGYQPEPATHPIGIPRERPPEPPPQPPPAPPPSASPTSASPPPAEPAGLPQRVPAEPDVPELPDAGPGGRERWTAPELAWIADQLKRDDVPQVPTEGLDVDAVLEAVRGVPGVRSASVRPNPNGVHTLRLDLADDADPGEVSRVVARLLEERMGLSAAPQEPPTPPPRTAAPAAAGTYETATLRHRAPEPVYPAPEPVYPALDPAVPALAYPAPDPAAPALAYPAPDPVAPTPAYPAPVAPRPARPEAAAPPQRAPHPEPGAAGPGPEPDEPEVVSRPLYPPQPGLRVVIDQVRVSTVGLDATVEVELTAGERRAHGVATGPAVDSYVVRLAAVSAANAIDMLLQEAESTEPPPGLISSRCFVEHTGMVPFGTTEVAVVVLLLVCGGWVEQLTGSALVDGDPRQAMVRATLGAVNRRMEALLG